MIQIVSWLWHDPLNRINQRSPYTPEKVRRWGAMVRANLQLEHELCVITDQTTADFGSHIRVIPLWPELAAMGRCWRRIKAFSAEMREIIGPRWAWMDLDSVVTGDLTPLFQRTEDIVFWQPKTTRTLYNGSMVLMASGCRAQVWERFSLAKAYREIGKARYTGSDQAWWSCVLGGNEAVWKPDPDGVCAYWHHCRPGPPPHCRVCYFPGGLKDNGDYVRRTSPWVAEYLDRAMALAEGEYAWDRQRRVVGERKVDERAPLRGGGYAGRSRGKLVGERTVQ